jgi:hypothetical protein
VDLTTGKPPRVLHTPASALFNRGVTGVAFNSRGTLLASASGDGTVRCRAVGVNPPASAAASPAFTAVHGRSRATCPRCSRLFQSVGD